MIEKNIEHIAYQLKLNKENKQPGAIVFIGAGCSVSAGIPTAKGIVDYVMENYGDNPDIKCFDKKPSYAELMKCLGPLERKKIFLCALPRSLYARNYYNVFGNTVFGLR